MGLSTGFRPRPDAERLRLARMLVSAPDVVEVEGDDGWVAACLAISGRRAVVGDAASATRVDRALRRFGFAKAARGHAPTVISADLRLRTTEHAAAPEPALSEEHGERALVSVLICGQRSDEAVEAAVASVHAQSWPCEAVVATHPEPGIALQQALDTCTGAAFLVLGPDEQLLPGAIRALASLLAAEATIAAVWGDAIVLEAGTGTPLAWQAGLQLPAAVATRASLELMPARLGACLVRREVENAARPPLSDLGNLEAHELFARWAAAGPAAAVPVPVCVFRAPAGVPASALREGWRLRASDHAAPKQRFVDGWRRATPDRDAAHAWARGLYARRLYQEAREEATRWVAPYTATEVTLRRQLGLPTPTGAPPDALIVVDDGDVGALEETLHRYAGRHALWVELEVHRDPLAPIRQLWEGTYGARQRLHAWVKHPGPWHLRLTSDPDWAPPRLDHVGFLPDIPAPDAVIALAAVHDWPLPQRTRSGLIEPAHAQARSLVQARLALRRGRPREAIPSLTRALRWMSGWLELWQLAEATFTAAGMGGYAQECRRQIASLSGAASMAGK